MNKKELLNTLKRIIFIISIVTCLIPVCVNADSTENSVSTADEFFTALSHQILEHKSQQLYYLSSEELKQQITVSQNIEEPFLYHYNPKEPLASGCYTYLTIHDFHMSWFLSRSRTLNVQMNFFVPKDTMQEYFKEMQQLANELRGENDYESVKAVHDYIIRRVEYDYNNVSTNYTDIEGFRENRMVCQGYSMASYVLLSYMGIPTRIVIGKAGDDNKRENHAWNVVQIDGKWYNYDATWDDLGGNDVGYNYFLKGRNDFPNHYPEGLYNSSEFLNSISEESYNTPTTLTNNLLHILLIVSFIIILVIVISIVMKSRVSVSYGSSVVGTVIEDDFDDTNINSTQF